MLIVEMKDLGSERVNSIPDLEAQLAELMKRLAESDPSGMTRLEMIMQRVRIGVTCEPVIR